MVRFAPALIALAIAAFPAAAAAQAIPKLDSRQEKQTPQQEGLQSCTTQAKNRGLNGDAERDFVAKCLTGRAGVGPSRQQVPADQQEIVCNRQAADLHLGGGRRSDFVKTCMAGNSDKKP